jgi:hypothetical protein
MKTELLGGKIRGKIGFLGGEKETHGVGREIFLFGFGSTHEIRFTFSSFIGPPLV